MILTDQTEIDEYKKFFKDRKTEAYITCDAFQKAIAEVNRFYINRDMIYVFVKSYELELGEGLEQKEKLNGFARILNEDSKKVAREQQEQQEGLRNFFEMLNSGGVQLVGRK